MDGHDRRPGIGQGRAGSQSSASGPAARVVLEAIASGPAPAPRRRACGWRAPQDAARRIDRRSSLFFPAPASFTGEDHGRVPRPWWAGRFGAVLDAVAGADGCRLAEPGEFTRRAFLNGRLDLDAPSRGWLTSSTPRPRRSGARPAGNSDGVLGRRVGELAQRAPRSVGPGWRPRSISPMRRTCRPCSGPSMSASVRPGPLGDRRSARRRRSGASGSAAARSWW